MNSLRMLLAGCSLLLLANCTKTPEPAPIAPVVPAAPAPLAADVAAKLATADAVDGKTDHVVGKCAGCALGMDGKPEHALTVGDYKMHFCKAACLAPFKADPSKEITALKLPH